MCPSAFFWLVVSQAPFAPQFLVNFCANHGSVPHFQSQTVTITPAMETNGHTLLRFTLNSSRFERHHVDAFFLPIAIHRWFHLNPNVALYRFTVSQGEFTRHRVHIHEHWLWARLRHHEPATAGCGRAIPKTMRRTEELPLKSCLTLNLVFSA